MVDLVGCSNLPNRALTHNSNTVTQPHCLYLIMGYIDGGYPNFFLEALELIAGRVPEFGIQVGEGLIKEKDGGLAYHGPGQGHPLPLPP